jgi:hypothetical protein
MATQTAIITHWQRILAGSLSASQRARAESELRKALKNDKRAA